jgi:hypothetical protein
MPSQSPISEGRKNINPALMSEKAAFAASAIRSGRVLAVVIFFS